MKNRKLLSIIIGLALIFSALGLAFAPSASLADDEIAVHNGLLRLAVAAPGDYLSGDAIPPYPDNPDNANCSAYLVGDPTTDEIRVTLVIEAGNAFDVFGDPILGTALRKELKVLLTGHDPKSVTSVLVALNGTDGLNFYASSGTPISPSSNYLGEVTVSGDYSASWSGGVVGFDGWMFRVNDRFPTQLTADGLGYEGTGILQTPVYDGDVVHFLYDMPSDLDSTSGNIAANYVRAVYSNFDNVNKKLTVQLQGHKLYIEPNTYIFDVFNYRNLGTGMVASLYTEDGTLIQRRQASSFNGTVTFTNNNVLESGRKYIVKTVPGYYYNEDWNIDANFFTLTGSYSIIEIPIP